MTETNQPRTEAAIDVVDREIQYATTERTAFRRFRSRLESIEPDSRPTAAATAGTSGGGVTLASGTESRDQALRAVRAAYRETVMAVPHFDSEYGESLRENLTAEFSADLATLVTEQRRLAPVHRDALASASDRAVRERGAYLQVVRRERESLIEVRDGLDRCEQAAAAVGRTIDDATSSDRLGTLDDRLVAIERDCASLAESRQELLHGRCASELSGVEGASLTGFLYGGSEETCPALADIADCLSTVRHHRKRCLR